MGISEALIHPTHAPNENEIFWDFYFLCDEAKYEVTYAKIVFEYSKI